jgi:TetR/AcrR family tetracycline transcriptional repressor
VSTVPRITSDLIAQTGLRLLNDVGLDGLSMRVLAKELGVQAPTLYWHVKNKQELLDAIADLMSAEVADGLEAPTRGETWQEWIGELARKMRRTMLKYRDGARVSAGAYASDPVVGRTVELILRTLRDAGFPLHLAARAFPVLLHYVVGFVIEEQARIGQAYSGDNPYDGDIRVDWIRQPLMAEVSAELYGPDTDANFEYGLGIVLTGMRVEVLGS